MRRNIGGHSDMDPQRHSDGKQFQYRGDLSETPLPEILARVGQFTVPGVLEAARDDVTTEIYIRDGHVVHARSSDIGTSLGVYLRRVGLLTQDQFRRVMRERRQTTYRLGVLLVERGLMAPGQVHEAIQRQTEAIVWSLFSWWQGSIKFKLGPWDPMDMIGIQLPLGRVIIDGIKRQTDVRQLMARIGGRDTVLEPAFTVEDAVEVGLSAEDFALLSLIDGHRTLYELCSRGPKGGKDNAKFLYAMVVLDLARPIHDRDSEAAPVSIRAFRRSDDSAA
ncbi:MAG: DUF4388 domain-containing protein [Acidobacteria bacterium]|nr:DUF4388 domain-containing protein [Acidobacteriota bacterium]